MRLRALTWNLFHGRSVPGTGRDGLPAFAEALAGWEWDVAALQEVPPWWPADLARRLGGEVREVRTSRNALGPVGIAAARRYPDAMKSWGGGANVVLSRTRPILATRTRRLCRWPERRWALGVELAGGAWIATAHCSRGPSAAAARDAATAAASARGWAAGRPLVLLGDLNLREVALEGFTLAGSSDVDHVLLAGEATATAPAQVLGHDRLSDHAPLLLEVELGPGAG